MQFSCSVGKKKKKKIIEDQVGMSLRSGMQGNKKCDLMGKRRIRGARQVAGIGIRGYKLCIVH